VEEPQVAGDGACRGAETQVEDVETGGEEEGELEWRSYGLAGGVGCWVVGGEYCYVKRVVLGGRVSY
jgi:hypothetical protein